MKNKILKSVLVLFILIILKFIYTYITYLISQEYVGVAANQLTDPTSYAKIKTQETVTYIVNCVYIFIMFVTCYRIYKIWK